ncbi:putative duf1665 domain protein [Phaeoacremonium minimum UCRPA7]|uniref:Putative duf1665 domain protein n=1 Tax=Phaeoacremonium minimum (strain UCR-PA7) TaxID=1286976 RepID=R8BLH5_PHAM7|nr:putative duf1665 domain protein [Phaeoacremonium minimum UCRPA7]EOO00236.1 putative duf1665 domain protein [Phaeoacremonium minimum UCRPA7]
MAGTTFKKRTRDDAPRSKAARPSKKQKKLYQYHSDSEEDAADNDDEGDFQAVNLLDSDEDLENAEVDDGASSAPSSSDSEADNDAPTSNFKARDAPLSDDGSDADSYSGDSDEDGEGGGARKKTKSKRNDPTAFATSLSKILSTKLSSSRRADPVLARSAAAHEASRQIVDTALESKARRRLREQKRLAMEKGRVKDVLIATNSTVDPTTGAVEGVEGAETTAQILETERRLRKVAQRGVVKLFNAVRAAQVKAAEAERLARTDGVVGVDRKKEKVTEMSRKGFLDLIASGGGGLKKGKLEEA